MSDKGKSKDLISLEKKIMKVMARIIKKHKLPMTATHDILGLIKEADTVGESRGLRFADAIMRAQDLCPKCRKLLLNPKCPVCNFKGKGI